MHLLIALKCPSSRSLFCLGFYLESCYNLCRAIRVFFVLGLWEERERGAGEGAWNEQRENGQRLRDVPRSSHRAGIHPNPGLSSALGLNQPKIMEQKKDKMRKKIPHGAWL